MWATVRLPSFEQFRKQNEWKTIEELWMQAINVFCCCCYIDLPFSLVFILSLHCYSLSLSSSFFWILCWCVIFFLPNSMHSPCTCRSDYCEITERVFYEQQSALENIFPYGRPTLISKCNNVKTNHTFLHFCRDWIKWALFCQIFVKIRRTIFHALF